MEIFIKGMLVWIFGNDLPGWKEYLIFTTDGSGGLNVSSVFNLVKNLSNSIILPFAVSLLALYYFLKMMEDISMEQGSLIKLAKNTMMLGIIYILLTNTFSIFTGIISIGNGLTKKAMDLQKIEGAVSSELYSSFFLGEQTISTDGHKLWTETIEPEVNQKFKWNKILDIMFTNIYWALVLLPAFLISVVAHFSIQLAGVTRIINMMIRLPFSPLALADMFNGIHGGGFRFMKGFFAYAIQGVMIYFVVLICNSLSSVIVSESDVGMLIINLSVVNLAKISLVGKTLEIGKEVLGV